MIYREEYELNYELFLAEQELYTNLIDYGFGIFTESVGLISITEAVKDTILTYINKVIKGIQNAWNKFKSIFNKKEDRDYLANLKEKIQKGPEPKFAVTNYPNYDIQKLNDIKLIPFNYEEMKDDLDNKSDFLKKYYPQVFRDEEKSFSQNIESYVTKIEDNHQISKDDLIDMVDYARDRKQDMDTLEANLEIVNHSTRNIENIANSLSSQETTQEASFLFESYLMEADEKRMEFKDDPDRQKAQDTGSFTKRISNYISICTDIITTKMKIIRRRYALSMRTLKHYMAPPKEEKKEETQTTQSQTQIEV